MIEEKFAYFPKIVRTWRRTKAFIWMQRYYVQVNNEGPLSLNWHPYDDYFIGKPYCNHIGKLSFELN